LLAITVDAQLASVEQCNVHTDCVLNDVVIRQNVTARIDDETGARGLRALCAILDRWMKRQSRRIAQRGRRDAHNSRQSVSGSRTERG
jgi:hypothetical protein